MSPLLISAHQPAIAGNIGREDGGQTPFDVRAGHSIVPDFQAEFMVEGALCLSSDDVRLKH
jgi:hypothetical protein